MALELFWCVVLVMNAELDALIRWHLDFSRGELVIFDDQYRLVIGSLRRQGYMVRRVEQAGQQHLAAAREDLEHFGTPADLTLADMPGITVLGFSAEGDGYPRYAVTGGMNALAKHLATGLDVRCPALVFAVRPGDGCWDVGLDDGTSVPADAMPTGQLTPVPPRPQYPPGFFARYCWWYSSAK